jgi:hypothetical protein
MIAAGAVHAFLSKAQGGSGPLWIASMGTDVALGLAVLSILGERVPAALKSLFATTAMFSLLGSSVVLVGVQGGLPSWPCCRWPRLRGRISLSCVLRPWRLSRRIC